MGILLIVFLALIVLSFLYRKEKTYLTERLAEQDANELSVLSRDIQVRLGRVAEDIRILADLPATQVFLREPTEANRKTLTQIFFQFSRYRNDYEQIRLLDTKGVEQVRVDMGGIVIGSEDFQDKSSRYYVKEGIRQNEGTIYVSPVDLNVELGVVETPYVPVIRYVLPLDLGAEGRKGILVINYRVGELLTRIKSMAVDNRSDIQILNADSYWILNEDSGVEWGFMFPEGEEKRLNLEYPELWTAIDSDEAGSMEAMGGYVTWLNFPIYSIVNDTHKIGSISTARYWKLLIHHDEEDLIYYYSHIKSIYIYIGLVFIGIGLIGGMYWRIRSKHREKIDEINELNAQAFMNAQVAVIQTDVEGRVISFNRAAEQLLGWTAEEVVERERITFFHEAFELEERANELMQIYEEAIEPGFDVYQFAVRDGKRDIREWLLTGKGRRKVPVILTISGVRDSTDEIIGYMAVAIDISDRKKVETALLEAKEKAEEVAQMKSQFLANMSHEIRTPMNGVIGLSNLLLDSELTPHQERLTKTLVNSAEVLLTVINDILDFSKIDAGAMTIEEAPFDLREVVDNTLMLYAPEADVKQIELINKMDPELTYLLLGDAHRITQILSNLIGNSIKFTDTGEVILSVEAKQMDAERIVVLFQVMDTGMGMSEEVQELIFMPFTQADASTTRKFGGTGLGLTITTKLVHMMDGKISVQSKLGEGTTFSVEIPLKCDLKHQNAGKTALPLVAFKNKRALVVDDNLTNLMVLKGQLSALGFTVKTVDNPDAGYVEYVNERDYELIVLDYLMPGIDGLELARRLQPYRAQTDSRLVILSSSQTSISEADKKAIGIDRQLTKPISPQVLKNVLLDIFAGLERKAKREPIEIPVVDEVKEESGLRIILADDDQTNQQVIQMQLNKLNLNVTIVGNGKELLEKLEAEVFDLVLLDCNMPVMGGFEAAMNIRKREVQEGYYGCGHKLWIIAMTALAFKEDRERCIESGMDDFLTKPARVKDIEETLERYPH